MLCNGFKSVGSRGAWVALLVECPTLDFGAGQDLTIVGLSTILGSALSMEST